MHVATALPLMTAAILGSPCTKFISDSDVNSDVLLGYTMDNGMLYKQPPASDCCALMCDFQFFGIIIFVYAKILFCVWECVCVWEGGRE